MPPKTILVTGANRGIGYAITQRLATTYPENTYLLGVRSLTSGEEAISTLQPLAPSTTFRAIQLDITSDASIAAAASTIQQQFNRLDILINNAAIAEIAAPGDASLREKCNRIFDANVTSFMQVTHAFVPLLHASLSKPRVINISSARGSVHKQTTELLPPTVSIPYSVSKTALNVCMLEMARLVPDVLFQAVSPGHCRTAFNGFRGTRDPLDGAEVVVRLVGDEEGEEWGMGFWEFEGGEVRSVPW